MWAGVPVAQVARAFGVSRQTIYTWLRRRPEVETRSSRPPRSPTRLPRRFRRQILKRRRQRWSSRRGASCATSGRGWEFVHVAIDDHTRIAYVEVVPDETAPTAAAFLARAVAWYAALGIVVERILTDNGSCYRALPFAEPTLTLGVGQRFTRPYRPQTNGKAARFIRTLLAAWAYERPYGRSGWRTRALPH